ncbi:TIGR02270 family protein [Cystobacter fuscus]|uniref:TIGR02270 family protein n=1 Tax=Cystobacter fuscus TaxID=43 RepID=UPI0037C0A2F1
MNIDQLEPLWDIVEVHVDEAEFFWTRWERSLDAPNYTLGEVARGPELRLMAHLDGLVANGPRAAERLLRPVIVDAEAEPSRVGSAALALLNSPGEEGLQAVFDALSTPGLRHSVMARALELCERRELEERLRALLQSPLAESVEAAARALCFKRIPIANNLTPLLEHPLPQLHALAVHAVLHEAQPKIHLRAILRALESPEATVRLSAIVTGVALGIPDVWQSCRKAAREGERIAMLLLALLGTSRDQEWLMDAVARPDTRADALWALGFSGTTTAAEVCVPYLGDKSLARIAGEAFCLITGLDLGERKLVIDAQDEELDPYESDDANLMPRPEDELLMPDAEGVRRWWAGHKSRFDAKIRYLRGVPLNLTTLLSALRDAPMRQRHSLALLLMLRTQGRYTVNTRALSQRQLVEFSQVTVLKERGLDVVAPFFGPGE